MAPAMQWLKVGFAESEDTFLPAFFALESEAFEA